MELVVERKRGTEHKRYLADVKAVCQEDARTNINVVSTSSKHAPIYIYIYSYIYYILYIYILRLCKTKTYNNGLEGNIKIGLIW